jgi:EpsI family protein
VRARADDASVDEEGRLMDDTASRSGMLRRDVLLGGLMAATAAVAYARTPRQKAMAIGPDQLDTVIPKDIGPWHFQTASGLILPPPDALAAQIYDQQLARTYESEDPAIPGVMMVIAYGSSQSGMLQVHRPEICYPAGGFRLSPTIPVEVPVPGREIPAQYFTATRELRTERVLYWTRVGNEIPRTWGQQRMAVIRSNLAMAIPDGVLVRLSTIGGDDASARAALDRFASLLVSRASPRGHRLLVGDAPGTPA